jgi:Zn finger protein HypA/HybF involved in hydrogenase expression
VRAARYNRRVSGGSESGDRGQSSGEPNVFQCRQCGKVFEARTGRAFCPECDSGDVERLTG